MERLDKQWCLEEFCHLGGGVYVIYLINDDGSGLKITLYPSGVCFFNSTYETGANKQERSYDTLPKKWAWIA